MSGLWVEAPCRLPGVRRERGGKLGEPWSVGIGLVARGPGCLLVKETQKKTPC